MVSITASDGLHHTDLDSGEEDPEVEAEVPVSSPLKMNFSPKLVAFLRGLCRDSFWSSCSLSYFACCFTVLREAATFPSAVFSSGSQILPQVDGPHLLEESRDFATQASGASRRRRRDDLFERRGPWFSLDHDIFAKRVARRRAAVGLPG